jgi:hypothetical protein
VVGIAVAGGVVGGTAGWAQAAAYPQEAPAAQPAAFAQVAPGVQDEDGTPEELATQANRGRTAKAAEKASAGFVPVRQLVDRPLAGVSPSKGELWLVENSGPTEPIRLEHLKSGRWSTEEAAPAGSDRGSISMAATARDDVWLSAAGTLRRYDGAAWTPVATPKGPGGTPMVASALTAPSRGTLYAALRAGWQDPAHVYRHAQGRWTDLGVPAGAGSYFSPMKIVVVDGGVSVLAYNYRAIDAYDYVNGSWSPGRQVGFNGGAQYSTVGGYYVSSALRHLVLGGSGFGGQLPRCQKWTPKGDEQCVSSVVASASAQLKNGTIVLGGHDYRTPQSPPAPPQRDVEGTFALRGTDGSERPIPGDPGRSTELVIAERNQNAAWAVTYEYGSAGPVYTLQRYDG